MNRVEFEKRFIKSVNDYNEFDTIKYLFDKSMVAYELANDCTDIINTETNSNSINIDIKCTNKDHIYSIINKIDKMGYAINLYGNLFKLNPIVNMKDNRVNICISDI